MNGETQQQYQQWWRQQLQLQAAARQQAWRQQAQLTPGGGQSPSPWTIAQPGVNAPYPNALLSRFPVSTLAEADPGNAMAGLFMGNEGVASNPLLLHALLGGEPGLANV